MAESKETRGSKGRPAGLGRGLSSLLGSDGGDYAALDKVRSTKEVPIELLAANHYQPRRLFNAEALEELVDSIREKGILQPILVRRTADGADQYEIIAGERRWRAAQKAGLHKVPVVIKDLTDAEMLEVALIENIQRADLSPVEEARGYDRLMAEFSYTQEQVGQLVGKSRSHVANLLRLLALPAAVQDMMDDGRLTMGHARALINATDPLALAKKIISDNLSVRAAEDLARSVKPAGARKGGRAVKERDPDTAALELDLSQTIGLRVSIQEKKNGSGELRVAYQTLDQLDDICRRLCER